MLKNSLSTKTSEEEESSSNKLTNHKQLNGKFFFNVHIIVNFICTELAIDDVAKIYIFLHTFSNVQNIFFRESALKAVEASLDLEQTVHKSLLELHATADKHNDPQMTDFIEGEYLGEQVDAEKEISDLITKMKRVGDGVGLHIIDKELQ